MDEISENMIQLNFMKFGRIISKHIIICPNNKSSLYPWLFYDHIIVLSFPFNMLGKLLKQKKKTSCIWRKKKRKRNKDEENRKIHGKFWFDQKKNKWKDRRHHVSPHAQDSLPPITWNRLPEISAVHLQIKMFPVSSFRIFLPAVHIYIYKPSN